VGNTFRRLSAYDHLRPLTDLASVAAENEHAVLEAIASELAAAVRKKKPWALEISLALPELPDDLGTTRRQATRARQRRIDGWHGLPKKIDVLTNGRLREWALKARATAAAAYINGVVSVESVVEDLGVEAVFVVGRPASWLPVETISVVLDLADMSGHIDTKSPGSCHTRVNADLVALYPTLLASAKPWIHTGLKSVELPGNKAFDNLDGWNCPNSTVVSRSALLLLTLPAWEIDARQVPVNPVCHAIVAARRESKLFHSKAGGRSHGSDSDSTADGLKSLLDGSPITDEVRSFIMGWARRRFDLVGL
jgi:hypothetical protein